MVARPLEALAARAQIADPSPRPAYQTAPAARPVPAVMSRLKKRLARALELEAVPWWGQIGGVGIKSTLWPLAWHRCQVADDGLEGLVEWNPVLRHYRAQITRGNETFEARAARLAGVVAQVEGQLARAEAKSGVAVAP